jgi:hypothetical protein
MLLTAGDCLLGRQLHGYDEFWPSDDPTHEIGAAWGGKELLRRLVQTHPTASATDWGACTTPAPVSTRRTTRLVPMIETWWPAIAVALANQGPQRPHRRFQLRHQAGQLRVPECRTDSVDRNGSVDRVVIQERQTDASMMIHMHQ